MNRILFKISLVSIFMGSFGAIESDFSNHNLAQAQPKAGENQPSAESKEINETIESSKKEKKSRKKRIKPTPKMIQQLELSLKKKPERAKLRAKVAAYHFRRKNYKKVIELLQSFYNTMPIKYQYYLADSLHVEKNFAEEIKVLDVILEGNEKDYLAHFKRGKAHQLIDKYDEAIQSFRMTIKHNKKYKKAYDGLVQIFTEKENNYELRLALLDILNEISRDSEYLNRICEVDYKIGFVDVTINSCLEAVYSERPDPKVFYYLALSYKAKPDMGKYKGVMLDAAKRFPKSELIQQAAGDLYYEEKNYAASFRYYKEAITANSTANGIQTTSADVWVGYANAAFELEKYELALIGYKKACEMDKKKFRGLQKLVTRLKLKNDTKFVSDYELQLDKCKQF